MNKTSVISSTIGGKENKYSSSSWHKSLKNGKKIGPKIQSKYSVGKYHSNYDDLKLGTEDLLETAGEENLYIEDDTSPISTSIKDDFGMPHTFWATKVQRTDLNKSNVTSIPR